MHVVRRGVSPLVDFSFAFSEKSLRVGFFVTKYIFFIRFWFEKKEGCKKIWDGIFFYGI